MLTVVRTVLADIPCLLFQDDRFSESSVLIHYHGWTGDKGDVNAPHQTLMRAASAGFTVIAPDCVEHGERRTDAWFRAMFNGWAFICDAMDRTRQEAPKLLNTALALPNVSCQNPQVAGVSMGGLIAQIVFAQDKRFASLISVIGRSSFHQADKWSAKPNLARGVINGARRMQLNPILNASLIGPSCSWMADRIWTAQPRSTRRRSA